jgi:hypothetical protein
MDPICDLNCQKEKDLALLKTALDNADVNREQDPVTYDKARIAYYTLLNGPGWLQTEKQRIARQDVLPVTSSYTTKFNALKGEKKAQSTFVSLADNLKAQQASDQSSNAFLDKEFKKEKDKADVLNRLHMFGDSSTINVTSFFTGTLFIDFLILILLLAILYFGFTKFSTLKSYVLPSSGSTSIT